MTLPLPNGPSDETLRDPTCSITGTSSAGKVLVTYCRKNQCGAICYLDLPTPMWRMFTPITIDELLESCTSTGIAFPAGNDLKAWVLAVTASNDRAN